MLFRSGVSNEIGESLSIVTKLSIILTVLIIATCVTFLTEITSNTATTALLMPILAATALGSGIDPVVLMLPAALSASCAFMLPVATAPNAIVFGTDKIKVSKMVAEGFALNLFGIFVITTVVFIWQKTFRRGARAKCPTNDISNYDLFDLAEAPAGNAWPVKFWISK